MSIKLYLNGTPGGTDGTEITSLTFKNLMSYVKGLSNDGLNGIAFLPVCLRETSGLIANNVQISGISTDAVRTYCSGNGFTAHTTDSFRCFINNTNCITIGQTNVLVFLAIMANDSVASGTKLFTISYVEDDA